MRFVLIPVVLRDVLVQFSDSDSEGHMVKQDVLRCCNPGSLGTQKLWTWVFVVVVILAQGAGSDQYVPAIVC